MRTIEEIERTAEAWREQEREENRQVISCEHDDSTILGLLIRCGHQYTRGLADGIEWALGGEHGALDRTARDAAEEDDKQ